MIKFCVLGSGSSGNSIYFQVGGIQFLVDAGFTRKELIKRLDRIGRKVEDLSFVVYSHRHGDHFREKTIPEITDRTELVSMARTIHLGDAKISCFHLQHDDPCLGFLIGDSDGNLVAVVSDTGCVDEVALGHLFDCSAILIECNYDIERLVNECPYPQDRKERIAGNDGHLANEDAAAVVGLVAGPELKFIVPLHLSSGNNDPVLAQYCMDALLTGAEVVVSYQKEPTKIMTII